MSLVPDPRIIDRLSALRRRCDAAGLTALLVTHPANVFYLTTFLGSAGVVVVTPDDACLITDARYASVAQGLVASAGGSSGLRFVEVESSYEETVCAVLTGAGLSRVGFETAHMTVARHAWLTHTLAGSGVTLCRTRGLVESLRQVKDERELATLREAGQRISRVMTTVLSDLRRDRREREVAADIDWAIRGAGFDRPAFDTIVAAGPNTALPHARPGDRRLADGDLVLLDFGGVYDGYCVDVTRVASLGTPNAEAVGWHEAVTAAHGAALGVVRPGVSAATVDAAARAALDERGLGAAFVHGTGHGLGIEVHEVPRVGKRRRTVGTSDATGAEGADARGRGAARVGDGVHRRAWRVSAGARRCAARGRSGRQDGHELLTSIPLDLVIV